MDKTMVLNNSTPQNFRDWLSTITDVGTLFYDPSTPTVMYFLVEGVTENPENTIQFEITSPMSAGIVIRVTCYGSAELERYANFLTSEIEKLWPDTKTLPNEPEKIATPIHPNIPERGRPEGPDIPLDKILEAARKRQSRIQKRLTQTELANELDTDVRNVQRALRHYGYKNYRSFLESLDKKRG